MANNKKIQNRAKIIKKSEKVEEGVKPLHKPLPNKFLVLLIKDVVINGSKKK